MNKKIIISEEQAKSIIAPFLPQKSEKSAPKIVQERFLYHTGDVDNVQNPTPHYSESRWQKWEGAGHETGSFGSGMYFTSAYPRDGRYYKDDTKSAVRKQELSEPGKNNFIQIGDALYCVDTEFYKNLYVLKSENEGKVLETLMESINGFFRTFNYPNKDSVKWRQYKFLQISSYAKKLGLSMPWNYREMCEFAEEYCKNTSIRQTPATIFMEKNGFNGVDASRAGKYDSYWQGSVIYDLSKVEQHITPALGPRNELNLSIGSLADRNMENDLLAQSADPTTFRKDSAFGQEDNPAEVIRVLKRYPYILPAYKFYTLPDSIKPTYLTILYNNILNGYVRTGVDYSLRGYVSIAELTNDWYLKEIYRFRKFQYINIDKKVTSAIVNDLCWGEFKIKKDVAIGFIKAYKGNLEQDYPEEWQMIKDEYGL